MGRPNAFPPELLVVGILYSPLSCGIEEILGPLELAFGPIRRTGPDLPFPWSGYYDEEMGGRPRRNFASFARLVDPSSLARIKNEANGLEAALSLGGRRRFNLDPGLLSPGRFVLATTKASPHRLPLADGIYAELTLLFQRGEYRPLPWTYPDWASEEYRVLLDGCRRELKAELRALRPDGPA